MNIELRINGSAPAWPALLEHTSAFYDPADSANLGSASYSITGFSDEKKTSMEWDILIDAGHNTVPFLIKHGNRIPDAVFLTHAHPDHILGVDWIVQSHRFKHKASGKKMPVYCTQGAWNMLMVTYSYLQPYVQFKELIPGQKQCIDEASGMYVTPYPVFHGKSALGASMLYFETPSPMAADLLITGDILCPLLRKRDISRISKAGVLLIDTNNRFPLPDSNHISFTGSSEPGEKINHILSKWFDRVSVPDLVQAHVTGNENKQVRSYFDELISDWQTSNEIPHTILDFLSMIPVPEVYLVHYWGVYDEIHYNAPILNAGRLQEWARNEAVEYGLSNVQIYIPKPGDCVTLQKN